MFRQRLFRSLLALGAILALTVSAGGSAYAKPWRLHEALSAPAWLELGGTYRVRYEHLNGDFRAGSSGSAQILVEQLLFGVRANFDSFYTGAEFEDARAHLYSANTPLGTGAVDTATLLRAYIGSKGSDVFATGDQLDVTAGRLTMDIGSRRLVARNRFRNTLNSFTGVQALWTGARETRVLAFYTLPVDRRPNTRARLEDNAIARDTESFKVRFWGVNLVQKHLLGGLTGEAYVFGLHEDDHPGVPTTNRHLITPGVRLFSVPARGAWDFGFEAIAQGGRSRATKSPADTKTLKRRAGFTHIHLGHTFAVPWSPRVALHYDYASAHFNSLFGVRREFGPLGIYGPLSRNNLNSPGVRIQIKPRSNLKGFLDYRAIWLANSRDALAKAKVRDPSGASGSFVGQQIEARVQTSVLQGNLRLEFAGAYLIHGRFLKDAPNAPRNGNTVYFYTMAMLVF